MSSATERFSKYSNSFSSFAEKYLFTKGYWIYLLVIVGIAFLMGVMKSTPKNPFVP